MFFVEDREQTTEIIRKKRGTYQNVCYIYSKAIRRMIGKMGTLRQKKPVAEHQLLRK